MPFIGTRTLAALVALVVATSVFTAADVQAQDLEATRWVAGWASAQMIASDDTALPPDRTEDVTVRQIVRSSLGGDRVRLRLSNAFGTTPLVVTSTRLALPTGRGRSAVRPETDRAVLFGGEAAVVIPPGAEYLSDVVEGPVEAGGDLAISVHIARVPERQTGHPGARATTFIAAGDQTGQPELTAPVALERWFFLAGVEVAAPPGTGTVVLFGDSITDGYGVPADSNGRWSDHLAHRLQASDATHRTGVLNLGIGGNRLLLDGLGPNAMARFERDVLGQAGVSHVVILEGVNDLGVLTRDGPVSPDAHAALVRQIIGAYQQMVSRARGRGIVAVGATIMPFGGSAYYHPEAPTEAARQAINAWIRAPGHFDAVIDFDRVMGDPARPGHLNPAYDSGDGLHPSMAGYKAMADAVPLEMFSQ